MGRQTLFLAVAAVFAVCACTNTTFGQENDRNAVQDGDWVDYRTWSFIEGSIPTAADDAQIEDDHTVYINPGDVAEAFRVLVGDNEGGNTGTITMTGGTLSTDKTMSLGGFETVSNGTGILNQSGGDIYIGAINPGPHWEQLVLGDSGTSHGVYHLSGGNIDIPEGLSIAHTVDATGEMHQTGGHVTIGNKEDDPGQGYFNVGNSGVGSYELVDGTVTMNTQPFYVGYAVTGEGTVTQSGGDISTPNLVVSRLGDAEYAMTGGSIIVSEDLMVGQNGVDGDKLGLLEQASGSISVAGSAWIANINKSQGSYSLSGNAVLGIETDLNVCAAVGKNGSTPAGATGTLNIDGEDVTITVGGDLVATGASVVDPEETWVNASLFNFTPSAAGGVSTIDVTGSADIDGAVFDIIEDGSLADGTILDLISAGGGISNFSTASVGSNASGVWNLRLSGAGSGILQAIKGDIPPVLGDTNNDYIVNEADAKILATNWGSNVGEAGSAAGDFNDDGMVNILDAAILAANWTPQSAERSVGAVPEPSIAVLLVGAMTLLLCRRRGSC
jgi:hypothetical protein